MASRGAYRSTLTTTSRSGAVLTLTGVTTAERLGLVVPRCVRCGAVTVLVNGVPVGTVSETASRTVKVASQQVVWLPRTARLSDATVQIRSRSRARVAVDGVVLG